MTNYAETHTCPLPPDESFESWKRFLYWAGHAVPRDFDTFTEEEFDRWWSLCRDWESPLFKSAIRSYQDYSPGVNTHTQTADGALHGDGICGRHTKASISRRVCNHRDIGTHEIGTVQWDDSERNPIVHEWNGPDFQQWNAETFWLAAEMHTRICGMWLADARVTNTPGDIYARSVRMDGESGVLANSQSPSRQMKPRSAGGRRRIPQNYDSGDTRIYASLENCLTIGYHELLHAWWADGHLSVRQFPGNIINPMFTGSRVKMVSGVWIPQVGDEERRLSVLNYGAPRGGTDPPPPGTDDEFTFFLAGRRGNGELKFSDPIKLEL